MVVTNTLTPSLSGSTVSPRKKKPQECALAVMHASGPGATSRCPRREVSEEDLRTAFEFLAEDAGELTLQSLRTRLAGIYGDADVVPVSELKFLMGQKNSLKLEDLQVMLDETQELLKTANIDPLRQVFNLFDPEKRGYVNTDVLGSIVRRLGYGAVSKEDMLLLVETLDVDADGKIGFHDFERMMMNMPHTKAEETIMIADLETTSASTSLDADLSGADLTDDNQSTFLT